MRRAAGVLGLWLAASAGAWAGGPPGAPVPGVAVVRVDFSPAPPETGPFPGGGPLAFESWLREAAAAVAGVRDHGTQLRGSGDEDAREDSNVQGRDPLPNFHPVTRGIYRSGQPSGEGFARVSRDGVRTLLNLRTRVGSEERREAARLGMRVVHVGMNGILSPSFDQVDHALDALRDPSGGATLVHCRFGKDRTGVVVAAYRVTVEGMEIRRAADEARGHGCCHPLFRDIESWLKDYRRHRRSRGAR